MPVHILTRAVVPAVGTRPKLIEEFFGRINSDDSAVSTARMCSRKAGSSRASSPNSTNIPSS